MSSPSVNKKAAQSGGVPIETVVSDKLSNNGRAQRQIAMPKMDIPIAAATVLIVSIVLRSGVQTPVVNLELEKLSNKASPDKSVTVETNLQDSLQSTATTRQTKLDMPPAAPTPDTVTSATTGASLSNQEPAAAVSTASVQARKLVALPKIEAITIPHEETMPTAPIAAGAIAHDEMLKKSADQSSELRDTISRMEKVCEGLS